MYVCMYVCMNDAKNVPLKCLGISIAFNTQYLPSYSMNNG